MGPLDFILSFFVRCLYWHAWWWPKYRPKHVAHMQSHNLNQNKPATE